MKRILTILFVLVNSVIYSQATLTDLNLVFDISESNSYSSPFVVKGTVLHSTSEYNGNDVNVGDLVYFQDGTTTYSLPIITIDSQSYSYVELQLIDISSTVSYVPTGRAALIRTSNPDLLPVPPDGIPSDLEAGILNDLRLKIQNGVTAAEEITDYAGGVIASPMVAPAVSPSSYTGKTWRNSMGVLYRSDGVAWTPIGGAAFDTLYTDATNQLLVLQGPNDSLSTSIIDIAPVQSVTAGTGISVVPYPGGVYTINNTGDLSNTNEIELPSQAGNNLKALYTNGTSPYWGTVASSIDTFGVYGPNLLVSLLNDGQPAKSTSASSILSAANGVSGTLASGQVAYGSGANTVTSNSGLLYNGTNFGVGGALSSIPYIVQVNGAATYRNASFTPTEPISSLLDIRNGSIVARSGTTDALWGAYIKGAFTFNTGNQVFGGLKIDLTSNATASQYVEPLIIDVNAATDAASRISNTNAVGASTLSIGGSTSSLVLRSPNGGGGSGARPGYNYLSPAGNFGWCIEGSAANGMFVRSNTTSTSPGGVNGSFFIRGDNTFIGNAAVPTFGATLTVRGSDALSTGYTAQFHNSTGSSNTFLVRNDGLVGIGAVNPQAKFNVEQTSSITTGSQYGQTLLTTVNPPSASSATNTAFRNYMSISGSSNITGSLIGNSSVINDTNSGTKSTITGADINITSSGGTTTTVAGSNVTIAYGDVPVGATNMRGYSAVLKGNASVGSCYYGRAETYYVRTPTTFRVFDADLSSVVTATTTASYGLYQTGNPTGARNYMQAPLVLGSDVSPTATLDVDGTVRLRTYPNTLNTAGSPVNVLSTSSTGVLESHTAAELVGAGISTSVGTGQVAYGTGTGITSSANMTYSEAGTYGTGQLVLKPAGNGYTYCPLLVQAAAGNASSQPLINVRDASGNIVFETGPATTYILNTLVYRNNLFTFGVLGNQVSLQSAGTGGNELRLLDAASTWKTTFYPTTGRLALNAASTGSTLDLKGQNALSTGYTIYALNTDNVPIFNVRNDGNIGIGTASPSQKLHVQGTARITGSDGTATTIMGRDGDGDISILGLGSGLSITSGVLNVSASGATNLAVTGTSSPLTLTSDTGTDVTFTAGTGISLVGTSSNITINNTGDTNAGDDLTTSTSFSGDVSGLYNNLQLGSSVIGATELADGSVTMAKINQASATSGQIISWNGTSWTPSNIGYGVSTDAIGTAESLTVTKIQNRPIATTAPTSGQVLAWSGSLWAPTTISSGGITSLNGQTGTTQTFFASSTGTDFAISSSGNVHTFVLPTANGTQTGKLTSSDWTTFSNKIGGSGTTDQLAIFTGSGTISSSSSLSYASSTLTVAGDISPTGKLKAGTLGSTPTVIVGRNASNEISSVSLGTGLSLASGTLSASNMYTADGTLSGYRTIGFGNNSIQFNSTGASANGVSQLVFFTKTTGSNFQIPISVFDETAAEKFIMNVASSSITLRTNTEDLKLGTSTKNWTMTNAGLLQFPGLASNPTSTANSMWFNTTTNRLMVKTNNNEVKTIATLQDDLVGTNTVWSTGFNIGSSSYGNIISNTLSADVTVTFGADLVEGRHYILHNSNDGATWGTFWTVASGYTVKFKGIGDLDSTDGLLTMPLDGQFRIVRFGTTIFISN